MELERRQMKRHIGYVGAMLAAAVAATGCGPGVGPATLVCASPNIATAYLAYPANGSTGVPTTIGALILGNAEPNITFNVGSSSQNIVAGASVLAAPSPLPSPLATAPPGGQLGGTYASLWLPQLTAQTTYTVSQNFVGCGGGTSVQPIGAFTTGS